jgi:hypothetical protein
MKDLYNHPFAGDPNSEFPSPGWGGSIRGLGPLIFEGWMQSNDWPQPLIDSFKQRLWQGNEPIFHKYNSSDGYLRMQIQELMNSGENPRSLAKFLDRAIEIIENDAEHELSTIEVAVALRFRFTFSFQ